MEFFEKLSDWFNAFTAWVERFLTRLFGSSNERRVAEIGFVRGKDGNVTIRRDSILDRINRLEPHYERLSDDELKQTAPRLRERLARGETLEGLLPDAFAAVREAGRRFLRMRHYDVQLVGGVILHRGMIAEMVTGEGKTLVATLPAFLNALAAHVHIVTVNDYLARRDMEWMGPIYLGLGLTVGTIQSQMSAPERRKAYECDITYGTNNEFGFDYLRDNMKPTRDHQCQGPLDFAIVDEIDNILIDEARTPLIISGPAYDDVTKYPKADRIARQLTKDAHFEIKEKEHTCHLTDEGVRKAEELAGVESFYTAGNMEWPHLIDNSLKAHHLYKRDVNYVVENGEVVIVDEFTGRKMPGRQWSDGLHQAVEAKEGVRVKEENQTLATITLQNFFKLYKKLAGMTGTAMTEASEFWKIYKLDVISVPTNKPLRRVEHPDVIFRSVKEKWDAVIDEIREVHKTGRPILVGTTSIENSEVVSAKLSKWGIRHNVLNAKYHEREAEIVAQAGRKAAVTIATNMAGRGTDIILGGNPEHMAWEELKQRYTSRLEVPKSEWDELSQRIAEREGMTAEGREVAELGGLHVIGTERHEARRIDLQLRGRSGRQGDPGSSRFFLSLEDDLMRIFAGEWVRNMLTRMGMKDGEAIESRFVTKRIEGAQKKVEERHFDTRKHLLEYDEVMDDQRKRVYSYRQRILDGENCRHLILEMIDQQVERATRHFLAEGYRWETITAWAGQEFGIEVDASDIRGMDHGQLEDYLRDEALGQAEDLIREQVDENLPEDAEDKTEWNWLALSKWANARYGLNTNDRELKKIGREGLFEYLHSRARETIGKYDFSLAGDLLAEDFPRRSLCGWLHQQFTLICDPDEFADVETPDEALARVRQKIDQLYREKEVLFPVAVGMTNFLHERMTGGGGGDKYNREGLVRWANDRFGSHLSPDDLKGKPREEVEHILAECSRRYYENGGNGDALNRVDEYLDRAWGDGNGRPAADGAARQDVLDQLARWANDEFRANVRPEDLEHLSREDARRRILAEYDHRYRPELSRAERDLLLEILDQAWKDHLYYMDHLRSVIGLEAYAQKDPKVEYKREGRRAFNSMWERIGQQVTQAIFRLDKESRDYVGSLWEITAVTHEDAASGGSYYPEDRGGAPPREPGQAVQVVEPIVNRAPRVGRNDPCPCGSGKKYKKCCGQGA
ncbi:MAG TPA: preprotein translocase subunit SecA [Planctomycetaceae bacterium]|nr:preprotein translocase subunit SecA [Planctomycetaceae bacterium]